MKLSQDISNRLDKINNSYVINKNDIKVTISRDDFYWLVYGAHELNDKVEEANKIFKDIKTVQTWDEWKDKDLNNRISDFLTEIKSN